MANVPSGSLDAITKTRFRVDPNSYEFNAAATGAAVNAGAGEFSASTAYFRVPCGLTVVTPLHYAHAHGSRYWPILLYSTFAALGLLVPRWVAVWGRLYIDVYTMQYINV
jgi:hypothetical protein